MRRHYFPIIGLLLFLSHPYCKGEEISCGNGISEPSCLVGDLCIKSGHTLQCTENAVCNQTSEVCECIEGYMETSYHFCLPHVGTSCSVHQCNEEAQLLCSETEECECSLEKTHFSWIQRKCVGLESSFCSHTLGCTDNAFCNSELDWICFCNGGYSPDAQGRCLPSYDTSCKLTASEDDELDYIYACNSFRFLECGENEKCTCSQGKVFDYRKNSCVSRVGQSCTHRITSDTERLEWCTNGAYCSPNGICQCSSNFQQTEDMLCVNTSAGFTLKIQFSLLFMLVVSTIKFFIL